MVPGESNMLVPTQVNSAADEARVLCVIRDMTNAEIQSKFTLNLPASTKGRDLIADVGKNLGYVEDTFNLAYESQSGTSQGEVIINLMQEARLQEICVNCGNGRRNNFNVLDKDGLQPVKVEPKDDWSGSMTGLLTGSSATAVGGGDSNYSSSSYPAPAYSSSYSTDYSYSYSSALIRSDTGYVGLVNQAMTCYLNSLLQTLYMTPEFRNAIYRWEFDGQEDEDRSIPYQLQRLFLNLQTSNKRAMETTDITKSFGWDSSESWQQHDVQELCRVMFDAMEKKWKNTDQADIINYLYQGKMKDYVKCLECKYESARLDTYLDIPLTIRPFGSTQAYGSSEEALRAFIQPETLDGGNQYFCERCNKKCDAHKGLKFITFPYLLTLQMKRFDFDYTTMHRVKLNDRMSFPEILNLNGLIEKDSDDLMGKNSKGAKSPDDHGDTVDGSQVQQNHVDEVNAGGNVTAVVDEGIDPGYCNSGSSVDGGEAVTLSAEAAANDKNAQDSKKQGPYEYELFSIMIHSGSAAGGHYYAYIKSFKDGQWYCFNDQNVTTITYDDIQKTFGGSSSSRGYYSSAFASSTNAYMLMYRQIDKERNKDFMQLEDFPEHLKRELTNLKDKEEAEKKQREVDRCTCKIKLFCFHPVHQKLCESKLHIHKDSTLHEATLLAWKQFELEEDVSKDCVRLVKYDEFHDWIERSYDDQDDVTMGEVLGGVKSMYTFDLLLEIKQPQQKFQEYKPGGVTVKVYQVDLESETINPPVTVRAYLTQTLTEFKEIIAEVAGVELEPMTCVLERYCSELKPLTVPNKTLKADGFVRSNKVFIECSGTEDNTVPFLQTKFYKLLDRYENTIRIHVGLPAFEKKETSVSNVTISLRGLDLDSIDQSDFSTKTHDQDEGIEDSDLEAKINSCDSSPPEGSTGPLRSSHGNQDEIHSMIGDAIHRNFSDPGESANNDSVQASASSSQQESPDDSQGQGQQNSDAEENWDEEENEPNEDNNDEEYRRYFSAAMHINAETNNRNLTVYVDKRITLRAFKKELEPYVGAVSDNFRMYRVYGNDQEIETTRLTDTLSAFGDDNKMNLKMGRALRKGEHRVKVFQLAPNDAEPCKFLLETIFSKEMTVLESKKLILSEIRTDSGQQLPLNRCRLRKKTWKNPGNIYLDNQTYEEGIHVLNNWEVFLEILPEAEKMASASHLAVYVRRWLPSEYRVGPLSELILDTHALIELKEKISQSSGIDVNDIEIAKGRGTFPCEVSLLDVHHELDWNPQVTSLNMWPLHIYEDGNVIYYRDKTEKLVELTDERRRELQTRENARLSKSSMRLAYSPRKEKALKIYTDDHPVNHRA